jgi:hypothetical protein
LICTDKNGYWNSTRLFLANQTTAASLITEK